MLYTFKETLNSITAIILLLYNVTTINDSTLIYIALGIMVGFVKLCSSFPLKFYSWIPEFCTYLTIIPLQCPYYSQKN